MAMNTLGTLTAIFLCVFFFSVPLIVKYHVYKPCVKHVVQGDVIILERYISPVWCRGVHLDLDTKFEAFVYDSEPIVDERERVRTFSTHQSVLPNDGLEYWGLHLLKGSRVKLSACARLIGAGVTVVKSHNGLNKCLDEHKKFGTRGGSSGEDSWSESESDEDTSSISSSQGAVMNESETPYVCKNSVHSADISSTYRCSQLSHDSKAIHTISVDIDATDYYYFLFSSKTYLEIIPNEVFMEFTIDRTHYHYASSSSNCSSGFECMANMTISGNQKIVVQVKNTNSTMKSHELNIVCKAREWIFFIFYAGFFLVIFICAFQ